MNYPQIGIHVRKDRLNGKDYPLLICTNLKNLETRNRPTLREISSYYFGERVGIIDTSIKGKAMLIGEATMGDGHYSEICVYTEEYWNKYYNDPFYGKHLIDQDSEFDWNGKRKYLYPMRNGILYDHPVEVTWNPERGDNRTYRFIEVKGGENNGD